MTRSYSQKTIKLLFGNSAARCAICRQLLILKRTNGDPDAIIGEIAHIYANSNDGPRPNPSMTQEEKNAYENLILLCPNHHIEIDEQPNKYSVEVLHDIKNQHEEWVKEKYADEMPNISFAELEVVTNAILDSPSEPEKDLFLITPQEKIQKNNLSSRVEYMMKLGMGKAIEVQAYINQISRFDTKFPERLKAGFVLEYNRLVEDGLEGDSLFEALLIFSSGGKGDFLHQSAGLAVIVYLFNKCEIFET